MSAELDQDVLRAEAMCDKHIEMLIKSGCDPSIALDRTWDAWCAATDKTYGNASQNEDKILANRLKRILSKER